MTAKRNGVGSRKLGLRPTKRALRRELKLSWPFRRQPRDRQLLPKL